MKKIISILALAATIVIVVLSCNKNESETISPKNQTVQMSQKDLAMEQRILSFQSQITSNLKSGSSYPIDTAVRFTEALVNYNYGVASSTLDSHHDFTVLISVSLTNGQVTLTEAAAVYNKIVDSLTVQFESLPSSNGHLIYADIFRLDSTAGSVTFGVRSAFCCGSTFTEPIWDDDIDYWYYGNGWCNAGGYCAGPYKDTHTDDDAAMQIMRKILIHIGLPPYRTYITDNITFDILGDGDISDSQGNEYDICDNFRVPEDPLDNYCDFYIMYQYEYTQFTPLHDCLTPTEMSFHYNGTHYALYDLIYECQYTADVVEGKVLTDVSMSGYAIMESEKTQYVHEVLAEYGVRHLNQNPPSPF